MADFPQYLKGLNPEQQSAVLQTEGPLLILAGAGAGKTKTLTYRILHLIKLGVVPEDILAITFTNKAAKEMRERVTDLLSHDPELNLPISFGLPGTMGKPFVSTFHSLAVHILKESGSHIGVHRHFVIYDRSDSRQVVKDALVSLGHDPKKMEPNKILSIISKEKGNFVSQEEYEAKNGDDYIGGIVSEVWKKYDAALTKEKALDFDDLLFKATHLLATNKEVREYYQNKWKYAHIDEYQDTNEVQYRLVQMLCSKHGNLAVVGDSDQCVLPDTKISTRLTGSTLIKKIPIKNVSKKHEVLCSSGNGNAYWQKIDNIKKNVYTGTIIEVKTASGKILKMTPQHILFASLPNDKNLYFTYLMYNARLGFRVGMAQGSRQSKPGEFSIGLQIRSNQEKADRMWVLKISESKQQATYWENYFSTYYGLPTIVFHVLGRRMASTQEDIDLLFNEINTRSRAEQLFKETGMSFDFPHYWPQGTTNLNTNRNRINLRLTMFGDRRVSIKSPWGGSKISINTTNHEIKKKLEQLGFKARKGKRGDWRCEIHRLDYGETERLSRSILSNIDNLVFVRSAQITKNKSMLFHPAANLHAGMSLAVNTALGVIEEKIISVKKSSYSGPVFDLNIKNVHNYIANNIVVHNCIYGWRGADIRNILKFEEDYPEAKVVLLEENYRSTQTILSAANKIIEKNIYRKKKNLFTKNSEGEKITIYTAFDEADEANFVANTVREIIDHGTDHKSPANPDEIAILFRANFQSRALEEAFLRKNIPYTLLGTKFFERKEVKDTLSYIKAALNPDSLADLKRIINEPARGIGKVTMLKVFEGKEHELPEGTLLKVKDFRRILAEIAKSATLIKASEVVKYTLAVSGIEKTLKEEKDNERLENVEELVTLAVKYDHLPAPEGIEKLLEDAALASDQDTLDDKKNQKNGPSVKLMTVHASKGLEFDYVFVSGLEQDLFPHSRANDPGVTPEQEEEERRLFYVALTRARKKLYLCHANVRTLFGSRQVNAPSEFLEDIDADLVEREDPATGIKSIFIDF